MDISVKYKDKKLYIAHIDESVKYALVTYDKERKKGLFKINLSELKFNKKQSTYISKLNSIL